jgi:monoterpene epsilon-lactone hydrolase
MLPIPRFRGPLHSRLSCARAVARAVAKAAARRLRQGPTLPGWNWNVEFGTAAIRENLKAAFALETAEKQRALLDCMIMKSAASGRVRREERDGFVGEVYTPSQISDKTLLYLHGGGFAVYPKDSYAGLISLLCEATNAVTYAVDYRLAPENPFPAALEDVRAAYDWLLAQGFDPARLVIAGDSAGGNLTIALLCDLRDRGKPLPSLGIALSPATEFDIERPSLRANEDYDWISADMALTWRDWYCREDERSLPLVSPIHANLRGLPPIYIQAGEAEILYDSVRAFVAEAKRQGADVQFESWPDMNHVFQFFGKDAPQSAEALRKISEVVKSTMHERVTS